MASPGASSSSFSAALVAEDFPLVEREEEMGMAPDKYREVFDLAQRGARAFRDGRFDEAISFYSKAQNLRSGDPIILSNRSSAFCMISQVLRERSAADSEYQPLNGLDPTTHAELALKDAEKVLAIDSSSARSYVLKAYALILLERYQEAREALLAGLQVDPLSVTLSNIIQKHFPEEYAERKSEHETMTYAGVDLMPLFVMDVVLPCQKMALNIFEPRYRLMVRRIMEGNHRMGMVAIDSATGTVADCGCEVEILECEPLPDGRFYLEVEGSRRFRILRSWDQDGYRVAEIEWLQDISLPEGSQERKELMERANAASELARTYIRRAREITRPVRRTRHLDLESMPGPQDPEKFSFWLVNLINLRPSDKLDLLRLRDTRERISRSLRLLGDAEQICRVQ
uniref:Lon N-terminal domain-containing protein n=1 Tax=Leersia perrieri TaxID=77586 RepID=A0A0D9VVI6_9ORYZ